MPQRRLYTVTRDLHLYLGLFLAPFAVVFSVSAIFLAHNWFPGSRREAAAPRVVAVSVPAGIEALDGRARVDALQSVLGSMGVAGEIGFVRHLPKEKRLVFAATVPGRETGVELDYAAQSAAVTQRDTGVWDGLVTLHKSPGQHLAALRGNWWPMRVWKYFADATVYLIFFICASGVYLWYVLRGERRAGLLFLAAGGLSFLGAVYALVS